MDPDRRKHPRFSPRSLQADCTLDTDTETLPISGEIIDISYSGIKINLIKPLFPDYSGKIKLSLKLPDSGVPIAIIGKIMHRPSENECALQFTKEQAEASIDDLLFSCIKLSDSTLLVKTS